MSTIDLADIYLIHIPIRSADQLASKAVVGWIANVARNPDVIRSEEGFQWRELFECVVGNARALSSEDVSLAALGYP